MSDVSFTERARVCSTSNTKLSTASQNTHPDKCICMVYVRNFGCHNWQKCHKHVSSFPEKTSTQLKYCVCKNIGMPFSRLIPNLVRCNWIRENGVKQARKFQTNIFAIRKSKLIELPQQPHRHRNHNIDVSLLDASSLSFVSVWIVWFSSLDANKNKYTDKNVHRGISGTAFMSNGTQ